MSEVLYDTIGSEYNLTRRADPYITGRLYEFLAPVANGLYLDIGCGTANYLTALSQKGLKFYGVDPSSTMLEKARQKNNNAIFIQAHAESLPLEDNFFDGCTATFTIHHWNDKQRGLLEVNRVLKSGARSVFLSFTPEQMKGYWLCHYFPEMMERSMNLIPGVEGMKELLNNAGFHLVKTENYFVQPDLQDHFLYSNKYRPEQYLNSSVRSNISSFSAFCSQGELDNGLKMLSEDIDTGRINDIIKSYDNENGDYLFLIAEKIFK